MELEEEVRLKEIQVLIKLRGFPLPKSKEAKSEISLDCRWTTGNCSNESSGACVLRRDSNYTSVRMPCKNHLNDYLTSEAGWEEL